MLTGVSVSVAGQICPQIINVDGRRTTSLDGLWKTIVDPYENGYYDYRRKPLADGFGSDKDLGDKSVLQEYNFAADKTLSVPGDWNTQRAALYYYEGTVWYKSGSTTTPSTECVNSSILPLSTTKRLFF